MKKTLYKKKGITIILLTALILLSACSQVVADSFIEIENREEQYENMNQELKDLKTIKVRYLSPERLKEMQERVYENYFRCNDDKEHQEETVTDDKYGVEHTIVYRTEDMYQLMEWGNFFIYYYGMLFGEDAYSETTGKDYLYETTEGLVIQKETEKLFELLGLAFGDSENGYVIDKTIVQGDNSVVVFIKRYIGGKELTLAHTPSTELMPEQVDEIEITFGNNEIIGISIYRLSETVEIKNYEGEALVNTPEKAYKLLANYISSWGGREELNVDTARIAYMVTQGEDGIYTLRPMADYYIQINNTRKMYQVDLTTKEVWDSVYCSNQVFNI